MRSWRAFALVPLVLCVVPCPPAVAGSDPSAKVALYTTASTTKLAQACTNGNPVTAGIPCVDYRTWGFPAPAAYHVYLVVVRAFGSGISGLSCGIRYDSTLVVADWRSCADSEFRGNWWPASGGSDRILWDPTDNCQRTQVDDDGVYAVAGVFYVYAYGNGRMEVTPNYLLPPQAEFVVRDCAGGVSDIRWIGGGTGFGGYGGHNPCIEADGGCGWGGAEPKYCCCKPGAPEELFLLSSRWQFCEHEGGTVITGPCADTCADICASVAVQRRSWGWIKARFD